MTSEAAKVDPPRPLPGAPGHHLSLVAFWFLLIEHHKARLLACVEVREDTGCWEWKRSGDGRYGHFHMLGKRFKAHVAAALLWRGIRLRTRVRSRRYRREQGRQAEQSGQQGKEQVAVDPVPNAGQRQFPVQR